MVSIEGSIPALITPMKDDADQSLDVAALHKLIELHKSAGTSGIVPCGTTGEAPTLSHAEHNQLVKESVDAAQGSGLLVIPGTGSNSTKEAMQLTEHAALAKADACLVVTPYYNKPTADGILAHFRLLNSIGIPLIVYNIPGRTGINIEPLVLLEIAVECSNVIGIKASNGNLDEITQAANLFRQHNLPVNILSGDDSLTLPILCVGGVGVISVLANIWPNTMASLVHLYRNQGQTQQAMLLMQIIHPLCLALLRFGANPAPIKALLNQQGIQVGGTRLPITALAQDRLADLVKIFEAVKAELIASNLYADAL